MLICPQCASSLTENQHFCAVCGYKLMNTAGDVSQPLLSPPIFPLTSPSGAEPDVANPHAAHPVQGALQKWLPRYPTNPIVGAIIGAVVAIIVCITLMLIYTLIVRAVSDGPISIAIENGLPIIPLVNFSPLDYIAFAQHPSLTLMFSPLLGRGRSNTTLDLPLTLLILIPAISLAIGGYFSASADRSNQLRLSLIRAAAIGPIYGVTMAMLITLFGDHQKTVNDYSSSLAVNTSIPALVLYGILWGTLFGMLGGFVKLFGQRWRASTVATLLNRPRSAVVASATGALAAIGVGLLLSMPLFFFVVGSADTQQQLRHMLNFPPSSGISTGVVLLGLTVLSLPAAAWLFAFSSGAFIVLNAPVGANGVSAPTRLGEAWIFNLPTEQHAYLLLVLIPVVAYFIGGRVTARVLGVVSLRQRVQASALMSVFSGILMCVLTLIGFNVSLADGGASGVPVSILGPDIGSSFLGALAFGIIFGMLGSTLYRFPRPRVSRRSGNPLLNRLTGQPARVWLYSAVTVSITLGVLATLGGTFGTTLSRSLPYTSLQNVVGIFGGVMLGLPLLLFIIALITDIATVPASPNATSVPQLPLTTPQPPPVSTPSAQGTALLNRSLGYTRSLILVGVGVIFVLTLYNLVPALISPDIRAKYPQVQAVISGVQPGAHVHVGQSITFSALNSSGNDLFYSWTFGDGTTSNQPTVTKVIGDNREIYQVSLAVADPLATSVGVYGLPFISLQSADRGHSSVVSNSLSLAPAPPTANFISYTDGYGNIYFDASSSVGSNLTYDWNFGDPTGLYGNASSSTVALANHVYSNKTSALYTVTLTVTDDHGQRATIAKLIAVPPTPGLP